MTYSNQNNQRPMGNSRSADPTVGSILSMMWKAPLVTGATFFWVVPAIAGFGWNFAVARQPISQNVSPSCVFWGGCAGWELAGLFIPGLDAAASQTKSLTDAMRSTSGYSQQGFGPGLGNPKPQQTLAPRQSQPIVP
jgi:hypothetical protein